MDKDQQSRAAGGQKSDPEVLILTNGRFHTVDKSKPAAQAVAIKDGKFLAVGDTEYVMRHRTPAMQIQMHIVQSRKHIRERSRKWSLSNN